MARPGIPSRFAGRFLPSAVSPMPAPSAQLLAPSARALLFDPPAKRDEALRRCALAPEDLALARRHRRSHNQLGFAVQLALVRDLGRPLRLDEAPHAAVVEAVADQLGIEPAVFALYARRDSTRREHAGRSRRCSTCGACARRTTAPRSGRPRPALRSSTPCWRRLRVGDARMEAQRLTPSKCRGFLQPTAWVVVIAIGLGRIWEFGGLFGCAVHVRAFIRRAQASKTRSEPEQTRERNRAGWSGWRCAARPKGCAHARPGRAMTHAKAMTSFNISATTPRHQVPCALPPSPIWPPRPTARSSSPVTDRWSAITFLASVGRTDRSPLGRRCR